MCRNIKTLHNFQPLATHEEIKTASLQYVRKVTGFHTPSQVNEAAFNHAVEEVASVTHELLHSLETTARPKNREIETAKAHARAFERFS